MSLEKIEKVRVCLREKEINLQGEMGKEDKKILAQLRIIIEENIAKIDFLFNILVEYLITLLKVIVVCITLRDNFIWLHQKRIDSGSMFTFKRTESDHDLI